MSSRVRLLLIGKFDSLSGGGGHFSRTVLGADNAGELWDVAVRRLRLTARSFYDPRYPYLLVVTIGLLIVGTIYLAIAAGFFWARSPVSNNPD